MQIVPVLIAIAAGIFGLVLLAGFFTAAYAMLLAGARSGAMITLPAERNLSWGERAGRKNGRANQLLVDPELRPLRRLLSGAIAAMIGSFTLLWLLLAVVAPWLG